MFAVDLKDRTVMFHCDNIAVYKGVFKGGGSGGSNPPPPKFSDFFLKSEGKEIERKGKKRDVWGGGVTS